VTAPAHLRRWAAGHAAGRLVPAGRSGCLPDRLSQGDQIVGGGWGCFELTLVADEFPATGRGETEGMSFTQVVGVRFGVGGEGADHSRGVRIHIGQGGDSGLGTSIAGAAPG